MRIVLDANIVIAALLGSRATLTIITSQNHMFYAPKFILKEVEKYKEDICERINQSELEFDENFEVLKVFINIANIEEYDLFMPKAKEAMEKRDWKDCDYLACALAVNADFIWTNDKDFTIQTLIIAKNTNEFIEEGR